MATDYDPGRKVMQLDSLADVIEDCRMDGKRIVLCHGCFDPLHVGHIRHFIEARRHGDVMVVTITPDRYLDKGDGHPFFNEELRIEAVAALEAVDLVALNEWPTAEETLRALRPDVYVKGSEFRNPGADPTGKMDLERAVADELDIDLVFTDGPVFSSTRLMDLLWSMENC